MTFGLWLVSWLSIYIGHRFRPWRCQQCGWHKPIFDHPTAAKDRTAADDKPSAPSLS